MLHIKTTVCCFSETDLWCDCPPHRLVQLGASGQILLPLVSLQFASLLSYRTPTVKTEIQSRVCALRVYPRCCLSANYMFELREEKQESLNVCSQFTVLCRCCIVGILS